MWILSYANSGRGLKLLDSRVFIQSCLINFVDNINVLHQENSKHKLQILDSIYIKTDENLLLV